MIKNIFFLLRTHQWLKNGFIFLPLFFGQKLLDYKILLSAVITFFAYSFMASGIYCLNDLIDIEADKKHPTKCNRPIASGAIAPWMAIFLIVCCIICAGSTTMLLDKHVRCHVIYILAIYFFQYSQLFVFETKSHC